MKPFAKRLDNILIIADGPLTKELDQVIFQQKKYLKIKLIRLTSSQGLGKALNAGVKKAKSDFLLRMDADDLSRPERLDALLDCLSKNPKSDVIGSYISEFNENLQNMIELGKYLSLMIKLRVEQNFERYESCILFNTYKSYHEC